MVTRAASILAAIALAGCLDPDAWSPDAEHRRATATRAAALAAHLEALPGIAHASVILDEPVADPLAPPAPVPPRHASVVLALAPGADAGATIAAAHAAAGVDADVIALPSPALAPPARDRLRTPLAVSLAVIAALAAWIAVITLRQRRGIRPQ